MKHVTNKYCIHFNCIINITSNIKQLFYIYFSISNRTKDSGGEEIYIRIYIISPVRSRFVYKNVQKKIVKIWHIYDRHTACYLS